MANIHTLNDVPTTPTADMTNAEPQYQPTKDYLHNLKKMIKMMKDNKHVGNLLPFFTDTETKKPARGILFSTEHPAHRRWDEKKLYRWIRQEMYEEEYGLGFFISGGIGVLDFDCEEDMKWFIQEFEIEEDTYFISQNLGKHNCSCDKEREHTYHLYFEMDDFWHSKTKKVSCIYADDGKTKRHIDFLRCSDKGTPHVIKCPTGAGERVWRQRPKDGIIKPLNIIISNYFKNNWVMSKREEFAEHRSMKLIDLCESINPDDITNNDLEMIVRELLGQGIDAEIIMNYTLFVRKENTFTNRVGAGSTKEYTDEEHIRWITNIMDTFIPDGLRRTTTIFSKSRNNMTKYNEIDTKWLNKYGTEFDTNYLKDLSFSTTMTTDEKRKKMIDYYNHFFVITTGMKKNGIYFKKFHNDGTMREVGLYQDPSQFQQFAGIMMRIDDEGKQVNTAKHWFGAKSITYDKVVFKPYGIKRNERIKISPNEFNTFSGLKMKYLPNYNKPEFNDLGDRIHHHISVVLCWDNKTKFGVDEKLYKFYRAWLYKMIVLGERTHIALVNYSKQKGVGKSMLSSGLMNHVVGKNLSMLNSSFSKLIKDTFTDYWEDCILATLEEMPQYSGDKDSKTGWDFCKALTTEDNMSSRGFMTAPDKMDIWVNLIINTNHFYSIDPGFMERRACVNIINPCYKDDNEYFAKCAPAFDSYDGWQNYIHRYLIGGYGEFSDTKVEPMECLIPDTKYRKMLNARGSDSVIYFFKELFENMADPDTPEEPYKRLLEGTPKRWSIKQLFKAFNVFKEENGVSDMSYKTVDDFEKAMMVKFEIDILSLNNTTKREKKQYEGQTVKTTPTVFRDGRVGKCIQIDEQLISAILSVVKHKQISTTDALSLTDEEILETFEDPSKYLNCMGDAGFLDESDDEGRDGLDI